MSSSVYAFTGPEQITEELRVPLEERLKTLPQPEKIITGAAYGVDTLALEVTLKIWPGAHQLVMVPNFRHNEPMVRGLEKSKNSRIEVVRMTRGGPLGRNIEMVRRCTALIALPASAQPYRSGTWHTIKVARGAHKRVYLWPLPALLA